MTLPYPELKSPFPAFGGKGRIVRPVHARLDGEWGTPSWDPARNWCENFVFSGPMTLQRRPEARGIETINDRNGFVSNFWRAVQADPDEVARWCDWPVIEADLHARHKWLVASDRATAALARVREDPDFFDAKIAGWWCWGACCWIGSGWCDETHRNSDAAQRPDLEGQMVTALSGWDGDAKRLEYNSDGLGRGVARLSEKLPRIDVRGSGTGVLRVPEQLPNIGGDAGASGVGMVASAGMKRVKLTGTGVGCGVHGLPDERSPGLGQGGWGVNAAGHEKRVRLAPFDAPGPGVCGDTGGVGGVGECRDRRAWLTRWMGSLSDRLRTVRVCCGHWSRISDSPSTTTRLGTTAVFLDPPYRTELKDGTKNRTKHIYANDRLQDVNALCDEVQAWAVEKGADRGMRIALCGLAGEYPEIDRLVKDGVWTELAWKSNGGYGNRKGEGATNENAARERVWFSPHCVKPAATTLFCGGEA